MDLSYREWENEEFGDCILEWKEKATYAEPSPYDHMPSEWKGQMNRTKHIWWYSNARQRPCPGNEHVLVPDFPGLPNEAGYSRTRTLEFDITLKSAAGCNCTYSSLTFNFTPLNNRTRRAFTIPLTSRIPANVTRKAP